MFQVAVCDDEAVFLDRTVQILHDAFGEMPHAIQTFQTAGAALSAIGETDYRPDIAVLDIRLADADGIALAKQINRSVPACRIIFLSSYTGYLMDAYEAEHVYYVLKPDMAARLPVALRKALTALASDKALTVRRGASVQRIALDRVLCLERFLHRTVIHMTGGDLETTQDPRELLESGQAEDHFIHCHKSFWVNEQMIASMERDQFPPQRRHAHSHQPLAPGRGQGGVFPAAGRPGRADRCAGRRRSCRGGRTAWCITVFLRTLFSTRA